MKGKGGVKNDLFDCFFEMVVWVKITDVKSFYIYQIWLQTEEKKFKLGR